MNTADTVTPNTHSQASERGWLHVALAVLAAAFVASPAMPGETGQAGLVFALLAAGAVCYVLQRDESARTHALSRGARIGIQAGAFLSALALLSIAYGLAASDVRVWVLLPAAAAFGITLGAVRMIDR